MKLSFSITSTPASRKRFKATPGFKSLLKTAAGLVAAEEPQSLSKLTSFRLSLILMTDDELLEINLSSLAHDYYTDVITFEIERTTKMLESEIYISVDRAEENARKLGIQPEREIAHLVIHGVLHLAGYTDKEARAKKQMRTRERFYLAKL